MKRFLNLGSITQSRTKAFQCLPSSHNNNQKYDDFHTGMTRIPTALHAPALAITLLICETGGRIQLFSPSQLPCQVGKTWNCNVKPWRYRCRQTCPLCGVPIYNQACGTHHHVWCNRQNRWFYSKDQPDN